MKLKYQMRGLGIGIVVTAILMGVALDDGVPLSDAEIKMLAAELGMVESDSLKLTDVQQDNAGMENSDNESGEKNSDNTAEPKIEPTVEPTSVPEEPMPGEATAEPTSEPTVEPTSEPTTEPAAESTQKPTMAPTAEPTTVPTAEPEKEPTVGVNITIVVKSGANSYSISKQLAEAGLVESAGDYDKYLCSNGYAERIQVGTFEIPMGSSDEKIAKIITKTQ